MTRRTATRAAGTMILVFVLTSCFGIAFSAPNGNLGGAATPLLVAYAAFTVVGALIVARRPDNSIGWIFSAIGLIAATGWLAQEYAEFGHVTRPGSLPGATAAAWYADWYWYPLIGLTLVFPALLFPTGGPVSPRWRPVVWVAAIGTGAVTVLAALTPVLSLQEEDYSIANPIGVAAVGDIEQSAVGTALFAVLLFCVAAAAVSLIVRFRRARGSERQQLKWFTYAGVLTAALPLGEEIVPSLNIGDVIFGAAVALVPCASGIAILKYRLYDIDVIINRTLVYGVLTAALALVYVTGVALFQQVFRPVTGTSELAVAGSTLAVAALFRPARAGIQRFIDRRFYRTKYDAAKTLEAFGTRLKDEVDLNTLSGELLAVVGNTLEPARASLWLRKEASR